MDIPVASRTWLITGVSSGFGRHLTEQVVERGDRMVGTVRDTGKVGDLLQRHPETFRADGARCVRHSCGPRGGRRSFARLRRIDVIVSNAGYGLFGAAEELPTRRSIT